MQPPLPQIALGAALERLHDPNLDVREAALDSIMELAEAELSAEQVSALLKAATRDFPPAKYDFQAYDEALVRATRHHLKDSHVPALSDTYEVLSERAKPAALAALAHLGSAVAAEAYIDLLRRYGWPTHAYPAVILPFEQRPRFETVLVPAFTDGSIERVPDDVRWGLVLAYASNDKIPAPSTRRIREAALIDAAIALARAEPLQGTDGCGWRWEETYADTRLTTGLLLDVLGHLGPEPASVDLLRQAEELRDPRLALFAAVSLVRLGEQPRLSTLDAVASDSETRNALFDLLSSVNKRELFPKSQLTQETLAESEMVRWLTFPTELGRAPDHIELMKTVERDLGGDAGVFVYYVFRFKTDPPHWSSEYGWTAGVSGPFRKIDFPTTESWGDTFSTFTRWDEFSAEEHLSTVEELLDESRRRHLGN